MVIKIVDFEFGSDNFEYEIYVNGLKNFSNVNEIGERIIDATSEDEILIRAKNIVLSSKWGWLLMFFYWILSFFAGTGDNNPFGKPFDAYIQFRTSSTYIELKANKVKKIKAFEVLSGKLDIDRNEYVSPSAYKIRWCIGYALPINLMVVAIFGMLMLVGIWVNSMVFKVTIGIMVVCLIGWNLYVYKTLSCLKNK